MWFSKLDACFPPVLAGVPVCGTAADGELVGADGALIVGPQSLPVDLDNVAAHAAHLHHIASLATTTIQSPSRIEFGAVAAPDPRAFPDALLFGMLAHDPAAPEIEIHWS